MTRYRPVIRGFALLAGCSLAATAGATEADLEARLAALEQQLAQQQQLQEQQASAQSRLKVNGYLSFVGTGTDQEGGTYGGVSRDDTDLETLSRAGLQLEFRLGDDTRFVTQLLSRGESNWQTSAEWAFLAHEVSASTTVRAGRLRLPLFLYSETLDVGYTQPWVSGPAEMYGILQFSSYEGVDLIYRFTGAGADWSVQPYFGYAKLGSAEGYATEARGDELHGIDVTATWGDLTVRAGYFGSRLNIPDFSLAKVAYAINESVRDNIADTAATGAATGATAGCVLGYSVCKGIYDSTYDATYAIVAAGLPDPDLTVSDTPTRYWSFGARYDNGQLLLLTEYTGSKVEGYFTDLTSCYGTAGYRFGRWMPHLTFSHLRVDDPEERTFPGALWDPDGPGPAPAVASPAGAFIASAFALDQRSWTVGVRYDWRPGLALKAEASRVGDFTPGSSGRWIPDSATTPLPEEFWVYRASLDLVF